MTYIDEAVEWLRTIAQQLPKHISRENEVGCTLWRRPCGQFIVPDPVTDLITGNIDQIQLYPENIPVQILQARNNCQANKYFGDFHTHPATVTWAGQLPSPDDLFDGLFSVLKDRYVFENPINGVSDIPMSPELQAIILIDSGCVLVFRPSPNRTAYLDLETQDTNIASLRSEYANWHKQTYASVLVEKEAEAKHRTLENAVQGINQMLHERVICDIVQ